MCQFVFHLAYYLGAPDEPDGPRKPDLPPFPLGPGFDVESGGPGLESIPDINIYQHKKTLAQGMMDLALLSANANQLRYVLESYDRHPYYYPSLVMVSLSLILQVSYYQRYCFKRKTFSWFSCRLQ